MSVDGLEPDVRLIQFLVVAKVDVLVLVVHVLFAAAEVDYEDLVYFLLEPHQEILRADVVIGQLLGVHPLDSVQDLVQDHQASLEGKLTPTELEQLLQGGPVEVCH